MILSPAKSKLMECANKDLRRIRIHGQHQGVSVRGKLVPPTMSERILGLYLDHDLSWRSYLWGESWRPQDNFPGMIPQLMGRAALLCKLATILPRSTMPSLVPGMCMSKLMYAMQVYCHTLELPSYRDTNYKAVSISKNDINILQRMQNRALRCITGGRIRDSSSRDLLKATGYLSVHQIGAFLTLTSLHNTILNGNPKWMVNTLQFLKDTRTRKRQLREISARLNVREKSYLPRAVKLFNLLPSDLKNQSKVKFRDAAKVWVWDNIEVKP